MAYTNAHIALLYAEPSFRSLVAASLVKQAIAVRTEATSTPNHAARTAYAYQVLTSPEDFINTFLRVTSAISSVVTPYAPGPPPTLPSDAVIDAAVAQVWDNLSTP
jgi:hypothetical protein